jgi:7-cyano-7-deazaguanine synthase
MESAKPKALLTLSGGLDSTVAAYIAAAEYDVVAALTFDYGQKARRRELASGYAIARRLDVPHRVVELPFFRSLAQGALLDQSAAIPAPAAGDLDDAAGAARSTARAVWVPNRNGIFIAVAAGWAEHVGATAVVVGFNAEEARTFADNSREFVERQNEALRFSTANGVRVYAPTVDWTKKDIMRHACARDLPLELCWPCYAGDDTWCRRCESCVRFARALAAADAETWFEGRRVRAKS